MTSISEAVAGDPAFLQRAHEPLRIVVGAQFEVGDIDRDTFDVEPSREPALQVAGHALDHLQSQRAADIRVFERRGELGRHTDAAVLARDARERLEADDLAGLNLRLVVRHDPAVLERRTYRSEHREPLLGRGPHRRVEHHVRLRPACLAR